MTIEAIAKLAARAASLRSWRTGVLEIVASTVPFDAAIFHALSPRVPLETGVFLGIPPAELSLTVSDWDEFGSLFEAVRVRANREGVATEDHLPRKARRLFLERVARPLRQRSMCMCHLIVREKFVAAVVLFSIRERAFGAAATAALQHFLPAIAAGDALHQHLDRVPMSSAPTRLSCVDQRLTLRQREVVEHVAMGHTNVEIAAALGLSSNAVRNHLARIFERVGAANRADLVRLAVMIPVQARRPGRKRETRSAAFAGTDIVLRRPSKSETRA